MLDSVDVSKIVVSSKWKINDTTCKYLCGYLNEGVVRPLCVILPQMNGYINGYYPIHYGKYVSTKLKIFNGMNNTTFTDNQVPVEKNNYVCIAAVNIDSVLNVVKKVYPQAYLEQCKYKIKKRRPADFIGFEIKIDSDDDDNN